MKNLNLPLLRTLGYATFGFILAGFLNLIVEGSVDNKPLIATAIILTTSVIMFVLNVLAATKVLNNEQLSEMVPTKLLGTGLSLTALLLTASIATLILVLKVQPIGNIHVALFAIMGILSLPQSVITSNIGLRLA